MEPKLKTSRRGGSKESLAVKTRNIGEAGMGKMRRKGAFLSWKNGNGKELREFYTCWGSKKQLF